MKRLLRVLGWTLGVVAVAWLGVCAWLSYAHPRVTFAAAELAVPPLPLPKGFLWGTATWSHQIDRQTLARTPAGGADVFAALAPP